MAEGNCEAICCLSAEIAWWIENIPTAFGKIKTILGVDYTIHTDASNEGWGASDGQLPDINGRWAFRDLHFHITCLN